jgi:hypothetical protein
MYAEAHIILFMFTCVYVGVEFGKLVSVGVVVHIPAGLVQNQSCDDAVIGDFSIERNNFRLGVVLSVYP